MYEYAALPLLDITMISGGRFVVVLPSPHDESKEYEGIKEEWFAGLAVLFEIRWGEVVNALFDRGENVQLATATCGGRKRRFGPLCLIFCCPVILVYRIGEEVYRKMIR